MSKPAFTPGPWWIAVDPRSASFDGNIIVSNDGPVVTQPYRIGRLGHANNSLIAAAPDLYAACEAAEKCLADYVKSHPNNAGPVMLELHQLRAALRLARGEAGDNNREAK